MVSEEWLTVEKDERLQLGQPPRFVVHVPTDVQLRSDQSELTLPVQVQAVPEVSEITWFVGDRPLVASADVLLTCDRNRACLSIKDDSLRRLLTDGSVLTVVAKNEFGTATSVGRVSISSEWLGARHMDVAVSQYLCSCS